MTAARRRRLETLERGRPYFDVTDMCLRLWAPFEAEHAATKAGRQFSRVPRREPAEPISEEDQAAFERTVAEQDTIARR
jgi:hypothetical protein